MPSASSNQMNMASVDPPLALPRAKLTGRAFYESLGSPNLILAPMVDQSEFVWVSLVYLAFIPLSVLTAFSRHGDYLQGPS